MAVSSSSICDFQTIFSLPLSQQCILAQGVFISNSIEKYVAPGIEHITEWLDISQSLAAVTLLAVANGAGDVITALVASGTSGGISYNIGSLYGAGLFCTSLIICKTILRSPIDIKIEKSVIYRDIGFYILATFVTLIFAYLYKQSLFLL